MTTKKIYLIGAQTELNTQKLSSYFIWNCLFVIELYYRILIKSRLLGSWTLGLEDIVNVCLPTCIIDYALYQSNLSNEPLSGCFYPKLIEFHREIRRPLCSQGTFFVTHRLPKSGTSMGATERQKIPQFSHKEAVYVPMGPDQWPHHSHPIRITASQKLLSLLCFYCSR